MKKTTFCVLLSTFTITSALFAQTEISTTPIGVMDLGAVAANSEITFSVPLLQGREATATVSSASSTVITLAGTPLVSGAYNAPVDAAPYMIEMASGASAGMFLPVSSNTDSTITVVLGGGDTLNGLANGDELIIRRAWTLETLLPAADLPNGAQVTAFDNQSQINNSASSVYLNSGGAWIDGATFGSADHVVLYPGESFVLINNSTTPISSLMIGGEIPTSPSRIRIGKDTAGVAQDTRIGYVGAVDEVLNDAGFSPANGDQLLIFEQTTAGINKSPDQVLIFNSSSGDWIDGATFSPAGASFKLEAGQGYIYRRSPGASVGDQVITDQQSYIPSLGN